MEYKSKDDFYQGIIDLNQEFQEDSFGKYVSGVIRAWYEDNKHLLRQIYEERALIEIPNWEE